MALKGETGHQVRLARPKAFGASRKRSFSGQVCCYMVAAAGQCCTFREADTSGTIAQMIPRPSEIGTAAQFSASGIGMASAWDLLPSE
jgi:hypothetical protein